MKKAASTTIAVAGLALSLGLASCGGDYDNALFGVIRDALEHPDSCSTEPNPQQPTLEQSLIAWWPFDSNNFGWDATGNGHDGNIVGTCRPTKGIKGSALLNDSYYGGLDIADDDAFKLTGSFSLSAWLRVDQLNSAHSLVFFRGDSRPGMDAYFVTVYPDKSLRFYIQDKANNAAMVKATIPLEKFVHCTAIFDAEAQSILLYVNGTLVNSTHTSLTPIDDLDQSQLPGIGIGHHAYRKGNDYSFTGALDEVRIYSRALTTEEVSTLYRSDLSK
jgi:hypothetical protein